MDEQVLMRQQQESNINVMGEEDYMSGTWSVLTNISGYVEEGPGKKPPIYKRILSNIIPLFKALVIISLFLVNGIGFSPLGCKTQYLFSPKFWFNKQFVIFFIIYFIINLGGYTVSVLSDPNRQLVLSILCLIFYNIIARLGEVWFDKNPVYWPGPLTYFGLIVWPLILLFVADDMRRYLMASHAITANKNEIDSIKWLEIGLIGVISIMMVVGLYKAIIQSKKTYGKNFEFISFLFGAPMILKGSKTRKAEHCTSGLFAKYDKITNAETTSGAKGFSGLLIFWIGISAFIALGTLSFKSKKIKKKLRRKAIVMENKETDKNLGKVRELK
jgi:hypothetical protein